MPPGTTPLCVTVRKPRERFVTQLGKRALRSQAGRGVWAVTLTGFGGGSGVSVDGAVVVKVCRDGTLVLRKGEDYSVLRTTALRGWPAVGPEVCSP